MDLVEQVYILIRKLPKEEIYALSSQIRRSAVSIPSNIAEGQKRKSSKEFSNFLSVSKGSNAELQTQLMICNRLNYLTKEETEPVINLTVEIDKMLEKLIHTLQ